MLLSVAYNWAIPSLHVDVVHKSQQVVVTIATGITTVSLSPRPHVSTHIPVLPHRKDQTSSTSSRPRLKALNSLNDNPRVMKSRSLARACETFLDGTLSKPPSVGPAPMACQRLSEGGSCAAGRHHLEPPLKNFNPARSERPVHRLKDWMPGFQLDAYTFRKPAHPNDTGLTSS